MANDQNNRKARYWYEYAGEKHMVPEHYVYKIHPTKGGGSDISESFFTWAFNKHNISITDIDIVYSSEDRKPKPSSKDATAASSTFFIAIVKGKDKRGVEKVGDGESGNESITNFQRGFPAGLAIKRAKVNMGKEFFNLVDLKLAIDCRDATVEFGENKGKSLEQLSTNPQGVNTIRWIASEKFTGDDVLKMKAQEFVELYLQGGNQPTGGNIPSTSTSTSTSNPNTTTHVGSGYGGSGSAYSNSQTRTNPNQNPNPNQNQNNRPNTPQSVTQDQLGVLGNYRKKKFLTDQQISGLVNELFGQGFSWKTATYEQGEKFIQKLEQLYGKL